LAGDDNEWGPWSEIKLDILRDYLNAFTRAVRGKSSEAIYLDLFAGSYNNRRKGGAGAFSGSARIALEATPNFTQLRFFELPGPAAALRKEIREDRFIDRRWEVVPGDSNQTIAGVLQSLNSIKWAPTFAFLDPRGLQVDWSTVEILADWRRHEKTKVELWILFPEPALARVLGLQGPRGRNTPAALDRVYGTRDWRAIYQMRQRGELRSDAMRAEFVNLYRWRLENVLGYQTTHALQLVNTRGSPVYTMVFATDSKPGDKIMSHVYDASALNDIPMMRARAQIARQRKKDEGLGVQALPGFDDVVTPSVTPRDQYRHVPPWSPPPVTMEDVPLEDTADIDPDDYGSEELG
jgi:three-Cys-motif partner protein